MFLFRNTLKNEKSEIQIIGKKQNNVIKKYFFNLIKLNKLNKTNKNPKKFTGTENKNKK